MILLTYFVLYGINDTEVYIYTLNYYYFPKDNPPKTRIVFFEYNKNTRENTGALNLPIKQIHFLNIHLQLNLFELN